MKSEPFNSFQLHLLKMFSYPKGERALEEIRKSLIALLYSKSRRGYGQVMG